MKAAIIILCVVWPLVVRAATINAASASRTDVGTAVSAASNGDTVVVPSGTPTWTTILNIDKAITLQGAGWDSTIIGDGIPGSGPLISWTLVANQNSRMTGIGFVNAGRGDTAFNGVVLATGGGYDSRRLRIDNCRFADLNGASIFTADVFGVIDHNHIYNSTSRILVYVYHENYGGYTFADGSIAAAPNFGTDEFLFIEDNALAYIAPTFYAATDAYRGARYVARNNTCTNIWWELHGEDSGGRRRGTRAVEIYNNDHYYDAGGAHNTFVNFRSGTGRVYDNRLYDYPSTPAIILAAYRLFATFAPYGYADGDSLWDSNSGSNPFFTGTATGGGTLTMTDSGASWTPSALVGYSLRNLTTGRSSIITANTGTEITFSDAGGFSPGNMAFSASDNYEVNLVLEVLSQPGKGQGTRWLNKPITTQTHLSGTVTCTVTAHGYSTSDFVGINETESTGTTLNGTFQITVTGDNTFTYAVSGSSTVNFPGNATKVIANDQVDEPIYEWNNLHNTSVNVGFSVSHPLQIRVTEHYVADTEAPGYTAFTHPHPLVATNVLRTFRVIGDARANTVTISGNP